MKSKFLLILSVMFFSGVVFADPWSGRVEITHLYPYSDGLTFITNYENTEISTCANGARFSINKSHPNYTILVSSMIAAFMSGKKINFKISSGQQPSCEPEIDRFFIYN
ncbi:MAG: hypothetical protein L3J84_06130 [Gammaproteobacteria bacterium]|nr:hypothetical protein [Gammaproteobacteria bacterium]